MISKIYLETTMFNFYYAPEKPGYETLKAQTRQVFDQIKAGKYEAYTSIYVTGEIEDNANTERREQMESLIAEGYNPIGIYRPVEVLDL
jgi:hypothetical protein